MVLNALTKFTTAIMVASSVVMAAPKGDMAKHDTSKLSLTAQLTLADSAIDRFNLLKDKDFVFDFGASGTGLATRKSFPALVGTGGAMAMAIFPPCSLAALHIHDRATELFIVLNGTVTTEMVPEAGVVTAKGTQRVIRNTLGAGHMTVFPMGTFHAQLNTACEPALTVAAFTSDDPGASLIAAGTFAMEDDFITPSFGGIIAGEDIDKIRHAIPQGPLFQIESCLKTCGIQKRSA